MPLWSLAGRRRAAPAPSSAAARRRRRRSRRPPPKRRRRRGLAGAPRTHVADRDARARLLAAHRDVVDLDQVAEPASAAPPGPTTCAAAASAASLPARTRAASRPLPKSGRLTRSPGRGEQHLLDQCRARARRRRPPAVRPRPSIAAAGRRRTVMSPSPAAGTALTHRRALRDLLDATGTRPALVGEHRRHAVDQHPRGRRGPLHVHARLRLGAGADRHLERAAGDRVAVGHRGDRLAADEHARVGGRRSGRRRRRAGR